MQTKKLPKLWVASLCGLCVVLFGIVAAYGSNVSSNQPPKPHPATPQFGLNTTRRQVTPGSVTATDEPSSAAPFRHASSTNPQKAPGPRLASVAGGNAFTAVRNSDRKMVVINNKEYPLRTYKTLMTPNDPSSSQWWVTNTKLNQAWDIPIGSRQTTLAIIDTGFGLKHEEFANRLYTNGGESGATASEQPSQLNCTDRGLPLDASCNLIDEDSDGVVDNETGSVTYQNPSRLNCTDQGKALDKSCNRIDDDGNGFVDDTTGWDFANNDNSPQAGELNPTGGGTTHGTRTMGVAAATGNNVKGIAGVDWQTKILPIEALDDDGYGDTLGVGRSIYYAASQHADVISISLGSVLPDDFVREAIQYATAQGSVVVAAAGNDGCNCISYPANYPEVVAVGALDTNNLPASFSSYGSNLDILAPGVSITTSNWTAANGTSAYVNNVAGTSFSTPMVAGMLTRMRSSQPTLAPLQLIAALTESTNRLTLPSTTSRTSTLGYGALDSQKAMARMVTPNNEFQQYDFTPISKGNYLYPTASTEPIGTYAIKRCADGVPGTTPIYELTKTGRHAFTISQVEVWLAQAAGYQANLVAEACLEQPQDSPTTIRALNLLNEIRNATDPHVAT